MLLRLGFIGIVAGLIWAQDYGVLRGRVVVDRTGDPLYRASVLIIGLGRRVETDVEGRYEFRQVPPGTYAVLAHLHPLSDLKQVVEVPAGGVAELDFRLTIAPVHEEVTVTASGREQSTLEAFQVTSSIELLDLAPKAAASLGEVLDGEAGVAKRSFGPGSSRPVVRGFDGDRVLILEDGLPTGTLSSQSGDHGEPVNVAAVERVEVVRGPATLLYGANALGGVVNVISGHHEIHQHPHQGLRGFLTGLGSSNNAGAGGSGGVEAGKVAWLLSLTAGGLRTGDYHSPLSRVPNSHTRLADLTANAARYGRKGYLRAGYAVHKGRYGIPAVLEPHHVDEDEHEHLHQHEGPVNLDWKRQNWRFAAGARDLNGALERFTLSLNYTDWNHKELVGAVVGTEFFNRQLAWRSALDHANGKWLKGSFGLFGLSRDYSIRGAEQLTPSVKQQVLAGFALQELSFERLRVQFGGRLETDRYHPERLVARAFTGLSGSAGAIVRLSSADSLLASLTHAYRAPAMEELYNHGPHHGNLAFEVGDPNLKGEQANGIEAAWRRRGRRLHAELSSFYYSLKNYVYLAPTGEFVEGLIKGLYRQADSRYMGAEARVDAELRRDVWLKLGFDTVDAELRRPRLALPRIPPTRGRVGLEVRWRDFSFRPQLLVAAPQAQLYLHETRTPGYARLNFSLGYIRAQTHWLHSFSAELFNATDRLYRNHVSLIKDFAPEMGRGIRFNYMVRFF